MVILVNFTGSKVTYDPAEIGIREDKNPQILLSTYDDRADDRDRSPGSLRPYEAVIIQ